MASSFFNRYRYLIDSLAKDLERSKRIKSSGGLKPTAINSVLGFGVFFTIDFSKLTKVKVVPYKNDSVIIGLELGVPLVSADAPSFDYVDYKDLKRYFIKIGKEDVFNSVYGDDSSSRPFVSNEDIVKFCNLEEFKPLNDCLKSIDNGEYEFKLEDIVFPDLVDRKIIPILIVNLKNMTLEYYNKVPSRSSYRGGRIKVDIRKGTLQGGLKFVQEIMDRHLRIPYSFAQGYSTYKGHNGIFNGSTIY